MASNVVTELSRVKMALARYSEGTIATIAEIALGRGGVDGNRNVKPHSDKDTALYDEIIRRPYHSSRKVSDTSYEYGIHLEEMELIGEYISEMALIDSEGDVVAFASFLEQGKDEAETDFYMVDSYTGGSV